MVALRKEDVYITPEEYLAGERLADSKHEYLAGVVHAMSGASREHNLISGDIFLSLGNQLRGKPCKVFTADMRVYIQRGAATFYYYPDIVVDCSGKGKLAVEEPGVIFEVLSPETERTDRAEKLRNYQTLPSLRVYALVDQFRPVVTLYRRDIAGEWTSEFYGSIEDTIALPEIDCALPLTAIYERMGF
jgi:Uma2 family endonuclease